MVLVPTHSSSSSPSSVESSERLVTCPRCSFQSSFSSSSALQIQTALISEDEHGNIRALATAGNDNDNDVDAVVAAAAAAAAAAAGARPPPTSVVGLRTASLFSRLLATFIRSFVSIALLACSIWLRNQFYPSLLDDLPSLEELESLLVKSPEDVSQWIELQPLSAQSDCAIFLGFFILCYVVADHFAKQSLELYLVDARSLQPVSWPRRALRSSLGVILLGFLLVPLEALVALCSTTGRRSLSDWLCSTRVMQPVAAPPEDAAAARHRNSAPHLSFMLPLALMTLAGAHLLYTGAWRPPTHTLGAELVKNGGFSGALQHWKPVVFRGRATDVSVTRESGNDVLRLFQFKSDDKDSGDWAAVGQSLGHLLKINQVYEFSVRYKQKPTDGRTPIRVGFRFTDPSLIRSAAPMTQASWNVERMRADGRWHKIKFRFRARPEFLTSNPVLWVGLDYYAGQGEVFIDDVSLRELKPKERKKIK